MRPLLFIILTTLVVSSTIPTLAQKPRSVDFYTNIKDYDFRKLWKSDSIRIEGDGDKIPFPEPLGFIGENFQRFYIYYTSVTKE